MKPTHYTTRIFIGLFIITMLLTYVALSLTYTYNQNLAISNFGPVVAVQKPKAVATVPPVPLLDTKAWPSYKDKTYPVSFQYPKGWTVLPSSKTNADGFSDITIKPSDKTPNIHISISKQSFLGFEGLKQDAYMLGDLKGVSINDTLIGLQAGDYYYTFDGSLNAKKIPEFKTLMSTVKFQ